MKTYFLLYFGSALLSLLCTPVIIRLARARRLYDAPDVRKVHPLAIPRIGGVAIVVSMLAVILPLLLGNNWAGDTFMRTRVIVLLAGAIFMFLVGLLDDLRSLSATSKLLCQFAAAAVVCALGIRIDRIVLANWLTIDFGWLSWPITILWIVAVTNAMNLIDGLDGLAAGISAITCAVIAVFALYTGQAIMAVLMLTLLGSLTGFLVFNFNPAKVFMGDCGSMFLGFLLAVSACVCAAKSVTIVGIAMPALALGIPIFDTLFSVVRRILERRSIFSPDRGHLHHRMLDMGLHQRHVVILIYLATIVVAGLGMFMMATRDLWTLAIFGGELLLLLLMFRLAGALRWREVIARLHRNRIIALEAQRHKRDFENAQLLIRQARTFPQWWQAVEQAARQMDFARVAMVTRNRTGSFRKLLWRCPGPVPPMQDLISVALPLRQRRSDQPLRLTLAVKVNGSLESAGQRAAFFSRLIDEHSLVDLPTDLTPSHALRRVFPAQSYPHAGLAEPAPATTTHSADRTVERAESSTT